MVPKPAGCPCRQETLRKSTCTPVAQTPNLSIFSLCVLCYWLASSVAVGVPGGTAVALEHHYRAHSGLLGWWGRANVRGKEPCPWSSLHSCGRGHRYWADSGGQVSVNDAGGCRDIGAPVLPLLILSTTSCESLLCWPHEHPLWVLGLGVRACFWHWPGGIDLWLLAPFHFKHWAQMEAARKNIRKNS